MDIELLRAVLRILKEGEHAYAGAEDLFARRGEFLIPLRARDAALEGVALDRFSSAFDGLELAILICRAVADLNRPPRGLLEDMNGSEWGALAITDLFHAGVLTAGEVLTLMRAGYLTGGLARWRALHEAATKLELLTGSGESLLDTAERYVRHEEFRENRAIELWKGLDRTLHPDDSSGRDLVSEFAAENAAAIEGYGDTFRGECGWAHEYLLATSAGYGKSFDRGDRERGPTFDDLAQAVRQDDENPPPVHWRHLYTIACAAVHGSPKAQWSSDESRSFMRIGPHVGELWQAGEATARRLQDLAWAFGHPDYGVDEEARTNESGLERLLEAVAHLCGMAESAFSLGRLNESMTAASNRGGRNHHVAESRAGEAACSIADLHRYRCGAWLWCAGSSAARCCLTPTPATLARLLLRALCDRQT